MTQPANSDKPDDALHLAAEAGNLEFSIFEDNGAVVSQNDENNDFTWGYYGWGNHTPQLIEAVDAVERNRGFEPPLFVDIRIRRTVRAKGFQGDAFEKLIGKDRHRWMKSLGNKFIETRTGPNIQIADPSAANELLALALDAAQHKQRLLFFCSCQWPRCEGEIACHRTTVAELVLRAARQRGVQVEIVEWPGGEPRRIDLDVTPHRVVGPAIRQPSQWVLPVLSADFDSATSLTDYESEAIKLRRKFGLEPALI